MKRLQWYLQQFAGAIGAPGLTGAALLMVAVIVQLMLVQPHQMELAQKKSSLLALQRQPQQTPLSHADNQQAQLGEFYAYFPSRAVLSEQLRALHKIAANQQLDMGQVDYKLVGISGTPLMRYQISYTILTDYPSLRRYIAEVLLTLPNAALENIELKRFSPEAEVPEAQMEFALYFRQGS